MGQLRHSDSLTLSQIGQRLLQALFKDHKGEDTDIERWCSGVIDAVYTNAFTVKKKKSGSSGYTNLENSNVAEETFLRFPTRKASTLIE